MPPIIPISRHFDQSTLSKMIDADSVVQRYRCPLLYPTPTGASCDHEQFHKEKGCVKDINQEAGGLMRVTLDRDSPLRRPVLQTEDGQPPHGVVPVGGRHGVQQRAHAVHGAGMVAREQLEREQSRPSTCRAVVVEPPAQELLLRAPAELADRAIRDRAGAEIARPRRRLDLVAPLLAQVGQLALASGLRQLVRLNRRFCKRHSRESTDATAENAPLRSPT